METSGSRARPCPKCGALNGAGFDRCIRCTAPLGALAVGTDALKAGARSSIDPRRLLGTKVLIGLTGLVFAAQLASMLRNDGLTLLGGGSRADLLRFGAMLISVEEARAEPFRVMSAVFVHMGVLHFLMNMMGLASTGRVVEPGVGSARFVFAYLTCGVVGFAANIGVEALLPSSGVVPVLTAGASGAVFGAMGMTLGWLLRMRDRRWRSIALELAFFAVVVNLLVRVNNVAHVGGLLCGVAFGFYFAGRPRPRSALLANIGAIAGLALAVASLVLAQRAGGWGKRPVPIGACPSVPAAAPAPPAAAPAPHDAASSAEPPSCPPPGTIDSPRDVPV